MKLLRGEHSVGRAPFTLGEAVAPLEEAGECTEVTPRGMGPSTYARNAEITSGRSYFQQGLAATCTDYEE